MTGNKRIWASIAAVVVIGAAVGVLVACFHIPTAVASVVMGVVIGTGVTLGAFSRASKGTDCN